MSEALSRATPFADAAEAYWANGWRGIVPVQAKYPPVTGYTGADGLWPSFADVTAWTEDHGDWNIALRLPDEIVGLDVDNYRDKRGAETLAECERLWGVLPDTWRSTSRSDPISGIRLYRVAAGLRWPGQLPGGGVEMITSYHRYCIVSPSRHPEGRSYRWTNNGLTSIGIPSPDELPELPQAWVEGLSRGSYLHESKLSANDLDSIGGGGEWLLQCNRATDRPCSRVRSLVARLASSLASSGSRHDAMSAAVLNIVRKGEQGHPGVVAALRTLGDAFVVAVTADGSRSTTVAWSEVTRSIDGAVRMVAAQPRTPSLGDPCVVPSDPPWDPDEQHTITHEHAGSTASVDLGAVEAQPEPELPLDVQARMHHLRVDRIARRLLDIEERPPEELPELPLLRFDELLAVPAEPVLYRIDQLMPIGSRVLLVAQMKTGKTTLTANLLRSLIDGEPFLGYDVAPTSGQVVLIDTEMASNMLRRWLEQIDIMRKAALTVVTLRGRVQAFDLRQERVFAHWVQQLRALSCSVLVIDCLKPILDHLGLDENRETGMITTPLTRLMIEAGVSELILVHHAGHNGERSRGDSALRGWPEVEWHIVRLADDPDKEAEMNAPRYFRAYGRDVDVPERRLEYDAQTRRLTIGGNGTRKADQAAQKAAEIDSAVLAVIAANPGTVKGRLPALLAESGSGRRRADVFSAVDRLIAREAVVVRFEGRSDSTHLLYAKSLAPSDSGGSR